jgi:hypothetical protein
MDTKDPEQDQRPSESTDDTEGHGLLLDTDYYIQRKSGRDAQVEREARERRLLKEARVNRPERR